MRARIKKKHANCLELEKKTSEQNLVLILFAERMVRVFSIDHTTKERGANAVPLYFQLLKFRISELLFGTFSPSAIFSAFSNFKTCLSFCFLCFRTTL